MSAIKAAFELFEAVGIGTHMIALDGLESDLIAVVNDGGINLYQSYGNVEHQSVCLPEECFSKLIKIMQERIE